MYILHMFSLISFTNWIVLCQCYVGLHTDVTTIGIALVGSLGQFPLFIIMCLINFIVREFTVPVTSSDHYSVQSILHKYTAAELATEDVSRRIKVVLPAFLLTLA